MNHPTRLGLQRIGPALLISLCTSLLATAAESDDLKVIVDTGEFAPGTELTVSASLPNGGAKQAAQSKTFNSRIRFIACLEITMASQAGVPNPHDWPPPSQMPMQDMYCSIPGAGARFVGKVESADDLLAGTASAHVFSEKLPLPVQKPSTLQHPASPGLWVIVRLSKEPMGTISTTAKPNFGSTRLEYHCQTPPHAPNGAEVCVYRASGDSKASTKAPLPQSTTKAMLVAKVSTSGDQLSVKDASDAEMKSETQALVAQGLQLAAKGMWADANVYFEEAGRISQNPYAMYLAAVSATRLRAPLDAFRHAKASHLAGSTISPEISQQVARIMEWARPAAIGRDEDCEHRPRDTMSICPIEREGTLEALVRKYFREDYGLFWFNRDKAEAEAAESCPDVQVWEKTGRLPSDTKNRCEARRVFYFYKFPDPSDTKLPPVDYQLPW